MLSAPLFVVVTCKVPFANPVNPYTSADAKLVRLAPLTAGKVAGNLASGIVPDVKLLALNAVRSTADQLRTPLVSVFKN